MAISKTLPLSNGLTVTDAYIRIDTVCGSKLQIESTANIYLSQAAFQGTGSFTEPQPYLEQVVLSFIPDVTDSGKNFIEQAYVNLKAQDRFSGAVDC